MLTLQHRPDYKKKVIQFTQSEAKELAADVLRAIEEAQDHEMAFPVQIFDGKDFVTLVILKD